MDINQLKKHLRQAAVKAFQETVKDLDQPLHDAIREDNYDYPRTTYRRSGEVVSSPRNIVDLGDLDKSQTLEIQDDKHAVYGWDVDYALYVHEGYKSKTGLDVPPRRWVNQMIDNTNIEQIFADKIKENL